MKRLLGTFFLLLGLAGVLFRVMGIVVGRQIVDEIGATMGQTLTKASDSLTTVQATLAQTKETSNELNQGLQTISQTAGNLSQTVGDAGPLLDQVSVVVTNDVPSSVEAVQMTIPDVAQAAGAIDDTMSLLSAFRLERRVFGIPIDFDLGIDYNPARPLDVTVLQLNDSLADMPDNLRALEDSLETAGQNLMTASEDLENIEVQMEQLRESIAVIEPLLDNYLELANETGQQLRLAQADLESSVGTIKLIITILFLWLALNQTVPLYLSWHLFRSQTTIGDDKTDSSS